MLKRLEDEVLYVKKGLPFRVDIDPSGAGDWPEEKRRLKEKYLIPLARSRYAALIERVNIDASGKEWQYWTCVVELKNFTRSPISFTHYGAFYNGRDNTDPDGYANARQYTLNALDNIARVTGLMQPPR